jgi:hypothetical protein
VDTKGNIKEFASLQEAHSEDYKTMLSRVEAEGLSALGPEQRHVALRKMRYASFSELTPKQRAKRVKRRKEQRRARRKNR